MTPDAADSAPLLDPTRRAGLAALQAFVPRAGGAYAKGRNYDFGAGRHRAVSTLSPVLRTRIVTEEEVLSAVLTRHSHTSAEKFVQEVFWRTYFKGWLEQRPVIWSAYQSGLARALDDVQTQSGLRLRWEAACTGATGIACFDAWAHELRDTGYLHNHARMWFASIWIFTLRLPWELGADFFLRHLLDGDPASNTLSWRWVGGLHTQGKHYLARAWNIKRYTEGRFDPEGLLDEAALPLPSTPHPPRMALPEDEAVPHGARAALLLHDEDLSPGFVLNGLAPLGTALVQTRASLSPLQISPLVTHYADGALEDAAQRWGDRLGPCVRPKTLGALAQWAASTGADVIVSPRAPTGPTADLQRALKARLAEQGQSLVLRMRPFDSAAWPYATAGFFKFKEKIPSLIAAQRARAA